MRQGQQNNNKRLRQRNRKGPNPLARSYESNGPDVKIRGTALHIAEKYVTLARDAHSSGDRVAAESYYQHAEHYYRIVAAAQAQMPQSQPIYRTDDDGDDGDEDRGYGVGDRGFGPRDDQPGYAPGEQPFVNGVYNGYNGDQRPDRGREFDRPREGDRRDNERPRETDRPREQDRGERHDRERPVIADRQVMADRQPGDRPVVDRGDRPQFDRAPRPPEQQQPLAFAAEDRGPPNEPGEAGDIGEPPSYRLRRRRPNRNRPRREDEPARVPGIEPAVEE